MSGFTISFSLQAHANDVSEAQVATSNRYATGNENVNKETLIGGSHHGSASYPVQNEQQIQPELPREQTGACPLSDSVGAAAETKDTADSCCSDESSFYRRNDHLARCEATGAGISSTTIITGTPAAISQPLPQADAVCPSFDAAFPSTARAPAARDFHALRESSEMSDSDESTSSTTSSSQSGETGFAFASFKRFSTTASAATPQLTHSSVSTQNAQGPDAPSLSSIGNTEQLEAPSSGLSAPLTPAAFGYTIPSAADRPARTLEDYSDDPIVTGTGFNITPREATVSTHVAESAPEPGTPISWKPWTPNTVPVSESLSVKLPVMNFSPIDLCGNGPVLLPGIAYSISSHPPSFFAPRSERSEIARNDIYQEISEKYQSVCAVPAYFHASHEVSFLARCQRQ
ncbi:hypothetical protein DFH11DRAFT_249850 [Phellopilus nigrolimitatus]|nr:hypothetical protein DFH11DRAFT_249850 [Phellopilus nigrolimitatus]